MSERGILVLKLDDAPPVTLAAHELRAHAATIPAAPDVENVAMARESAAPVANYGYRRRYAPTCCARRATGYEPSRETPSELRARAANELQRLGPSPATTRARVQWRERRGSAAITLAAMADWNTELLVEAASLAEREHDDDTCVLLREASAWTRR